MGNTEKMNIRFTQEFYRFIEKKAFDEHLPPSTFVRKVLMDTLNYNSKKDEVLTS